MRVNEDRICNVVIKFIFLDQIQITFYERQIMFLLFADILVLREPGIIVRPPR